MDRDFFHRLTSSDRTNIHCRFERLEDRVYLSAQPLQLIAESGSYDVDTIRSLVSLNEDGDAAFIGGTSNGSAVFVAEESFVPPKLISFSTPSTNRDYGSSAVINNSLTGDNQVAARDRVSGAPASFIMRRWNADLPGTWTSIASTSSLDPEHFNAVQSTMTDINDNNEVVFVGLDTRFGVMQKMRVREERSGNTLNVGDFSSSAQLRPQISNTTEVVFLSQSGNSIFRTEPVDLAAGSATATLARVAGVPEAFIGGSLGRAPGISDDGKSIAFTGENTDGTGVWVSLRVPRGMPGDRQLIQVAGFADELEDGVRLVEFGSNSRIGIGGELRNNGDRQEDGRMSKLFVTFLANDPSSGTEALWRVDLKLKAIVPEELPSLGSFEVVSNSGPKKIAAVGESVDLATTNVSSVTRTITDLEIYDPVTDRGTIGFWASFANGESGVIRALPPAPTVVNVVTHGFGREFAYRHPFLGEITIPMFGPGFLDVWNGLESTFNELPEPGSDLDGEVETYITNWNSSDGWVPAFVSYIAEQIATLPIPGLPSIPPEVAEIARTIGESNLLKARFHAESAAREVVQSLEQSGLIQDPDDSVNGDQIIHLVGHSRGGAVNARVAELLVNKNYVVDQYTSLDGYSTDWPEPANFLADIDIPGTIASLGDGVNKTVNYQVGVGLEKISPFLAELFSTVAAGLYSLAPATLSGVVRDALSGLIAVRAPSRPGFDKNEMIVTETGEPVAHVAVTGFPGIDDVVGITEVYALSKDRVDGNTYILDNYLGMNRDLGLPPASSVLSDLTIGTNTGFSGSSLTSAAISVSNVGFRDGGFDGVADLQDEAAAIDYPDIGDDFFNFWVTMATDTATTLASVWDVAGNVVVVREAENPVVELTQSNISTNLGQNVLIDSGMTAFQFDLKVEMPGVSDEMQVFFKNELLSTIDLGALSPGAWNTMTVDIASLVGQVGSLRLELIGSAFDPAVVRLDSYQLLTSLPGDFNTDGSVDAADLEQWEGDFGLNGDSDADADGDSDGIDFLAWQRSFSATTGAVHTESNSNDLSEGDSNLTARKATIGQVDTSPRTAFSSRLPAFTAEQSTTIESQQADSTFTAQLVDAVIALEWMDKEFPDDEARTANYSQPTSAAYDVHYSGEVSTYVPIGTVNLESLIKPRSDDGEDTDDVWLSDEFLERTFG